MKQIQNAMSATVRSNLIQLGNIKVNEIDEEMKIKERNTLLPSQSLQSVQDQTVQEKVTTSVPTVSLQTQATPKLQTPEKEAVLQTENVVNSGVAAISQAEATSTSPPVQPSLRGGSPEVGKVEKVESTQPTQPTQPTQSSESIQPTQSSESIQPTQSKHSHVASKSLVSRMQKLLAKNDPDGEPVAEVDQKLNDVKAYPADHKFLLVLFTTEEVTPFDPVNHREN